MAHSVIWLTVLNSRKGQEGQTNDKSLFPTREIDPKSKYRMTEVPCIIIVHLEL